LTGVTFKSNEDLRLAQNLWEFIYLKIRDKQ
jgi:hypothetical protein